jgi:hypothetical protein
MSELRDYERVDIVLQVFALRTPIYFIHSYCDANAYC